VQTDRRTRRNSHIRSGLCPNGGPTEPSELSQNSSRDRQENDRLEPRRPVRGRQRHNRTMGPSDKRLPCGIWPRVLGLGSLSRGRSVHPVRDCKLPMPWARCIPWRQSSILQASPNVAWHEHRSAKDPDLPQRVLNGFAVLNLNGPQLQEFFYDENGGIACP
jgi:hypothetical protein